MVALAKPNLWNDEPITVQRGDIWQLGPHRLMCGDSTNAEDVSRLMQGEKADLTFADPPYGIGIDAWDKAIEDVSTFIDLITTNLKQCGFFAFTHQMPYMVDWLLALKSSPLKYKDHVAWVKRHTNAAALPLLRSHESLFIYSQDNSTYYTTKGKYTDIKLPGVLFDVVSIEAIDRYINDLHLKIKLGTSTSTRKPSTKGNSAYTYMYKGTERSPEHANFTNVWSFLPEHTYQKGHMTGHATSKPILLMNRLLELCTSKHALVYDAFLGSGTTLLSAEKTGRRCYGMELSPEYCSAAIQRWQEQTGQQAVREVR